MRFDEPHPSHERSSPTRLRASAHASYIGRSCISLWRLHPAVLSINKSINNPSKYSYFYYRNNSFLQQYATCFYPYGEAVTIIHKGLFLYIYVTASIHNGLLVDTYSELLQKQNFF